MLNMSAENGGFWGTTKEAFFKLENHHLLEAMETTMAQVHLLINRCLCRSNNFK
ncbi:MAG UNVERIFIED_CONTAM: hypothetical protein LVQ98_03520 [Rickettsiaceae bacterium]|jgi:hypothetical protein